MKTEWETVVMGNSKLILHMGSHQTSWEDLTKIETPEPTKSWTPIPHARLIEEVLETLGRTGLTAKESAFATYQHGAQFFGLLGLDVKGGDGSYQICVGLRNSHDKTFPVGMMVGSRVFVCDNLSFSSEIQVTRRHTKNLVDDLPRLVATACGRIEDNAVTQEARFNRYKEFDIGDTEAHDLIIQALDVAAIGSNMIPKVLHQWREPAHAEFAEKKNIWRLLQGFTEVYKSAPIWNLSNRTIALQGILDLTSRFEPPMADVQGIIDAAIAG